jgi:hypothetical protein
MLWCSPTDAPLPLLSFAIATLCIEKLHVGHSSTTAHLKLRSSVVSTCGSPVSVTFLQANDRCRQQHKSCLIIALKHWLLDLW